VIVGLTSKLMPGFWILLWVIFIGHSWMPQV